MDITEEPGAPVDTTAGAPATADGDDIVVVPGGTAAPAHGRRRAAWIVGGIGLVAVVLGAGALWMSSGGSSSSVHTTAPSAPTPTVPAATKTKAKSVVVAKKPAVAATTVPAPAPTAAPRPVSAAPPVSTQAVAPPPAVVPATVPSVPVYALQWSAPAHLSMPTGGKAAVAISAHNPTNGVATLPHPLSCTPRLDHGEMCAQVTQTVAPGETVGAHYTIDATGVKPGNYTLTVEGVRTITVTVTA